MPRRSEFAAGQRASGRPGRPRKPIRIPTSALTADFRRVLISKKQTARLLNVSVRTVEHRMSSGDLAFVRIGDRRFVSLATLFAFAEGDHHIAA